MQLRSGRALRILYFTVFLWMCFAQGLCFAAVGIELATPQKVVVRFDLPRQKLVDSIIEFSVQSEIDIATEVEYVEGFYSRPVIGAFTPEEALDLLLSDAPLSYQFQAGKKFVAIFPVDDEVADSEALDYQSSLLEEVLVRGGRYPFRYASIANSQTHGGIYTFDSARYINILPQQLIVDQQPADVTDSLKNSSSITPGDGLADSNDDFYIRGFPRHAMYVDGFRLENTNGTKMLPALIDKVEIIKGPSTVYFGQAEPGGVVNVIRKRPKIEPRKQLALSVGTGHSRKFEIDLTGPLLKDKHQLLYRFIIANENRDESRNLADIKRDLVSTAFDWAVNGSTNLSLGFDIQRSRHTRTIDTWYSEPDVNGSQVSGLIDTPNFSSLYKLANFRASHYFGLSWLFQASYFKQEENRHGYRGLSNTFVSSNALTDNVDLYHRLFSDAQRLVFLEENNDLLLNSNDSAENRFYKSIVVIDAFPYERALAKADYGRVSLEGSPEVFGLTHHVNVGLDRYDSSIRQDMGQARFTPSDIQNSVGYVGEYPRFMESLLVFDSYRAERRQLNYREWGLYFQNSIELNPHWLVSLGGRFIKTNGTRKNQVMDYSTDQHYTLNFQPQRTTEAGKNVTRKNLKPIGRLAKQIGLVYKPMDDYTLYANYSESIKTNYHIDNVVGGLTKPELSEQIEFGVKTMLFNGKLISTMSLFNIEKENVLRSFYFRGEEDISGRRETSGVNLDFTYQFSHQFDIVGAASLLDPKIVSNDNNNGNRPAQVSKETASLFMNYHLEEGKFSGLMFSLGAYYIGDRYTDNENAEVGNPVADSAEGTETNQGGFLPVASKLLSEYSVFDMGLSYRFNWSAVTNKLRLSVKNITNNDYDYSAAARIRRNQGDRRNYLLSLHVEF